MAIKLLLIDQRTIFLKNFEKYINENQKGKINLFSFTSADKFNAYCSNPNILHDEKSFDILLCNSDVYSEIQVHDGIEMEILLVGEKINAEYMDMIKINKYSSAEIIINEINKLYSKSTNKILNFSNGEKTQSIFVCSPIGGSGKTTVSISLANALTDLGKKVLYLPLSLDGMYYKGQSHDFGYVISSKDSAIISTEVTSIKYKYNSKFDILPGFENPFDYYDVDKETWKTLFTNLKKYLEYDYIIVDTMDVCHQNTMEMLRSANHILFVANGGTVEKNKFDLFIDALNKRKYGDLLLKSFLVKNQSFGKKEMYELQSEKAFLDSAFVPYDTNLKYVDNHGLIVSDKSNTTAILKQFCAKHF